MTAIIYTPFSCRGHDQRFHSIVSSWLFDDWSLVATKMKENVQIKNKRKKIWALKKKLGSSYPRISKPHYRTFLVREFGSFGKANR